MNIFTNLQIIAAENLPSLPAGGPTNDWYNAWNNYLSPMPHILLQLAQWLGVWIARWLFSVGQGVQTAWDTAWNLVTFATVFTGGPNSSAGSSVNLAALVPLIFFLGMIVLGIVLAIQLAMFALTNGKQGKEWPQGIVMAMLIIGFVPLLLAGGIKVAHATNSAILNSGNTQVMVQLWKYNSVDLPGLAKKDFKVNNANVSEYNPFTQRLGNNPSAKKQNEFIGNSIWTSATSDSDALKNLNDSQKKVFDSKAGPEDSIIPISKGITGVLDDSYPMVKVNWPGIIAGSIVYIFAGFWAIYELLLRSYRNAYYSLMLLWYAWRDLTSKKALQILQLMEGSITGMALLPVGMLIFYGWISISFATINSSGLNWWPYTILSISILLAGVAGLMGGFSLIDQWTGVPTGRGSALQNVSSMLMAGNAAKSMFGGQGGRSSSGSDAGKNASEKAKEVSGGMAEKIGGLAGKATGFAQNAKNLPKAAVNSGIDKARDAAQGKVDDIKKGYSEGKAKVADFADSHSKNSFQSSNDETPQSDAMNVDSDSEGHNNMTRSHENEEVPASEASQQLSEGSSSNSTDNQTSRDNMPQSTSADNNSRTSQSRAQNNGTTSAPSSSQKSNSTPMSVNSASSSSPSDQPAPSYDKPLNTTDHDQARSDANQTVEGKSLGDKEYEEPFEFPEVKFPTYD